MSLKKIYGRLKYYYFDRYYKNFKWRHFTLKNFKDLNIEKICFFFHPIRYKNDVQIETLDFCFLNQKKKFSSSDLSNDQGSYYLWSYMFNYMEYLPGEFFSLEKKYNKRKASKILISFLMSWFYSHPISSKHAWFPYPISKRLEYLLKTYSLTKDFLESNENKFFRYQIYLHKIILEQNLEYYLGYNHQLQNYKSLILASKSMNNNTQLFEYLNKYLTQILNEVDGDGCYIEKTPMYQLQIIIDILDILNSIADVVYIKKNQFLNKLIQMTDYLIEIEGPDGQLPMLNDTSLFYPINWNDIKPQIITEIKKFARNQKMIYPKMVDEKKIIKQFISSGIIISRTKSFWILSDNGSLGASDLAGHGHADNLMILLSFINGKKIFIDSGIGSYKKGFLRDMFRSTMMHNTLSIDGQNSSEVWADFRVGNEAIPKMHKCNMDENFIMINGEIEWPSGEKHTRNILIDRINDTIHITDQVRDIGTSHKIYVNFILSPDIKFKITENEIILNDKIRMSHVKYDYINSEMVYYSDDWDVFNKTHRISFVKENYHEKEKMVIKIQLLTKKIMD